MDLSLKISVLQANFCWLRDFEQAICPWKESVSGKQAIQVVRGDLMCRIAALCYLSENSKPRASANKKCPIKIKY